MDKNQLTTFASISIIVASFTAIILFLLPNSNSIQQYNYTSIPLQRQVLPAFAKRPLENPIPTVLPTLTPTLSTVISPSLTKKPEPTPTKTKQEDTKNQTQNNSQDDFRDIDEALHLLQYDLDKLDEDMTIPDEEE